MYQEDEVMNEMLAWTTKRFELTVTSLIELILPSLYDSDAEHHEANAVG